MDILIAHNYYQQPGGEDQSFAAEAKVLEDRGHAVIRHCVHNDSIEGMSRLSVAGQTVWSGSSAREIKRLIKEHRPDVVHFNNTFPLISPAAYYAAASEGVAVVQSLRNFRLLCVNAQFFRDGRVCEDCLGSPLAWRGVLHKCYRNNRAASATVAGMVAVHRAMGTWRNKVDLYIALAQSGRRKFIEGGLPPEKIVVKPNFVYPDPGVGPGDGNYAVFVGRLSPEKGLGTMLKAWDLLGERMPLRIIGDGPQVDEVRQAAARNPAVQWLGRKSIQEVYSIIGSAAVLVFPSEWYETFGRVGAEAYAKGTPVIASNLGAMAELVDHNRTGLLFEPGNPQDLAAKVNEFLAFSPERRQAMRYAARAEYEAKYTADRNYEMLMDIYRTAIERRKQRRRR